jgi:hypothetical protein
MSESGRRLDVDFERRGPGEEFRGDVPTKHVFEQNYDNYYETFVREVLQNCNDAGSGREGPVGVNFRFRKLSGEGLERFQQAINWSKLSKHYEAAFGDSHSLRLEEFLTHLREEEELLMLVVEDENTVGLTGSEDERAGETPYTSLIRDWQVTYKEGTSAGGSHGVGKSVLWASSGISTCLFNSTLSRPDPRDDSPRLIGRAILPDHYLDDDHRHGKGWLGWKDESSQIEHPISVWDGEAEELATALGVERRSDEPGTTVGIVGFCSPVGELDPDIEEVMDDFVEAAVKNFWPAIHRGNLEVMVEAPDGTQIDATIDEVPEVEPFVECYERRNDPVEEVEKPGDVGRETVEFQFTRKDTDETFEARATVCARPIRPSEDESLKNRTAIFRGSGMVVDYVEKAEPAAYGHEYNAVLMAGEARGWNGGTSSKTDDEAEEFLKTAEPASHDRWGSTPKLKKKYKRGCVGTAKSLQGDKLLRALEEIVGEETEREGQFIPSIAKKLPDMGDVGGDGEGGSERKSGSTLRVDRHFGFERDHWAFSGWVEPKEEETTEHEWGAEISIVKSGEDGATTGYEDVNADRFSLSTDGAEMQRVVKGDTDEEHVVVVVDVESGIDGFEFEGESVAIENVDPWSGHGGDTDLRVKKTDPRGGD